MEVEFYNKAIKEFKEKILFRAHGNYTKSYESFKRIENAEQFFREAINNNETKQAVLDVGCGDGYHICLFNTIKGVQERVNFIGLDVSTADIEFGKRLCHEFGFKNIQFKICSADDLTIESNSIDIVLCSDVVEHLQSPEKCFSEMFRVLKENGQAIVTTPNFGSPIANLQRRRNQPEKQPDKAAERDDHISLKSLQEWVNVAKEAGFGVIDIRRGSLIFGNYQWNRRPLLFCLILIIDKILDVIPYSYIWCEAFTMKLHKLKKGSDGRLRLS